MATAAQRPSPEPPSLEAVFEAEQGLVGLLMRDPDSYDRISGILTGEDWTERLHRGVFEAIGLLRAAGRPVAPQSVLERASDVGPDGSPAMRYLVGLIGRAPTAALAEPLAKLLAEAARVRGEPDPYEHDLYTWAFAQAQHLRRGRFEALDALTLAEEIEDLGSEIYNRLESALRITLMHLLKWDHQPGRRTRSWTLSIRNGRRDAQRILDRHPGVRARLDGAIHAAYERARLDASGETGLDESAFPAVCPYTFDAMMARPVPWPDAGSTA